MDASESIFQNAGTDGLVLGIDAGSERIGLSISDPSRTIAFPVDTVNRKDVIDVIRQLAGEKTIIEIVVGLPLTLRGERGPQAKRIAGLVRALRRKLPHIPVVEFDERFSSQHADRVQRETGKKGPGRDALAAAMILEGYLSFRNRKNPARSAR